MSCRVVAISFSLLSLLTGTTASFAQQTHSIHEPPRMFRGIRSVGMGGVVTTTGNYSEALFGNPARHAEPDTWKFTMLEVQAETNSELISSKSDLSSVTSSSGSGTLSGASKLIGKNEHVAAHMLIGYYNPDLFEDFGFAVALLARASSNLRVNYTTDIDTQTIVDVGPHFGFAHSFFDRTLSLGVNLHFVYRVAADGIVNSLDFLTGSKLSLQNFGKQGFGVDSDLGAYYRIPWELPFMRLGVGISLNNLVKSHYDEVASALLSGVGSRPTHNDRMLNFGFRFNFPNFWIFSAPLLAFEIQDIGSERRMSFPKKTHLGAEMRVSRVLALRMGLNQGYPGGGLGFQFPVVRLDFATYGEELAGTAGQAEDRRYLMRLAFEL